QPTDDGVEVLDIVDHRAVRKAQAIVDERRVPLVPRALRVRDDLARVADVLAVYLAQLGGELYLVRASRRAFGRRDEIVEALELPQSVLTADLVEPRHAALAVANQVERGDVEHAGRRIALRQRQVLQEQAVIAESQCAEPLPPHAERPVGDPVALQNVAGP